MKKANQVVISFLLPGLLQIAGCRGTVGNPSEKVDVAFSILESDTRTTVTSGEGHVNHWTLMLYREGKLIDVRTSGAMSPIHCSIEAGVYTAYAIANPPSSFRPEAYSTFSQFSKAESNLIDNSLSQLVMFGSRTITVPAQNSRPQTINVNRLVAKVGIRKISTDFTDPTLLSRTFRLKAIYLTNCYGKTHLRDDVGASEMNANASCWYNRMGFHTNAGVDALLADQGINAIITASSPYVQEHHFYCYPNQTNQDSRSGNWSIRHTRLVLEADINDKTYFYPITLPAMQRNKTYFVEEAIIRKLGSTDPEKDEPGSIDVIFNTSIDDWGPAYTVQENS
jgi:hypothetical protein